MMKKLLKLTKYISVLTLAIFFTTCDDDDDNLPEVIAGFTYTINIDTGTVTFINTSENSGTYIWDFGDGTTSTQINPIKTYENGTYTIVLEAINPAGASNTFEDEITILIPEIATLPISFDGENTSYDAETFGGASFEVVDNPDQSGTNTSSSKVGAVTNIGAAFEGFYFDLGAPLDLSTLGSVSMNFWADSPVDVLMKLEEGTAGPIETSASHGGTGWEIIIFSFDSTDSYSRLTMFVDGPGTTAGTFYLDDITQVETPPDPCTDETEESLAAADFNLTFLSDPSASIFEDGADFEWIDNPDFENEVNKSCKVGQITKLGNNPWDNNQIDLDAKLDFNNNTGLKIKVWSAIDNTEVRIKLEEIGNPGNFSEQFTTTSVTSAWEELEIPFTSADSDRFDKIVIFFDLNAGNTDTYYFDDLALYGTGSGGGGGGSFDSGLLTNGDFETGVAAPDWYGNAANVVDQGGNFVNEANVMNAVNPWEVNLSQALALEADKTYELSFVAYTDDTTGSRSIIAGIGEAADNFDSVTETPVLTSAPQTFTYQLTVNYNDFANSRVLFDMGAETGFVFIDDVSLFCVDCDSGGGGGGEDDPDVAAPTPPARNAEDVISLFSNAYNDITIDAWSAVWDDSDIEDLQIEGNDTKKIIFTNFIGVEFQSSRFDATEFTHFHMDIYTPTDTQDKSFNLKFSNWDGGSAEANAIEYSVNNGNFLTNPNPGTWISLDIPLANFTPIGNANRNDIVQFVITSNLGIVYFDNLYLYKE